MNFRTKIMSAVVMLCVMSFAAGFCINEGFGAEEPMEVIGKATIKKGTVLVIILMDETYGSMMGSVEAFEEQVVYITKKMEAELGVHTGGFILDGEGFISNCTAHGREVLKGKAMIVLPMEIITTGGVTIELF